MNIGCHAQITGEAVLSVESPERNPTGLYIPVLTPIHIGKAIRFSKKAPVIADVFFLAPQIFLIFLASLTCVNCILIQYSRAIVLLRPVVRDKFAQTDLLEISNFFDGLSEPITAC